MSSSAMSFGDRMKLYERAGTSVLMPLLPICVRLDGRCFSRWTRHMDKPFDERLQGIFAETMIDLIAESNAVIGYTQSDEITLILKGADPQSNREAYFGGKAQKICSVLASVCTSKFNVWCRFRDTLPKEATFDCRVWQVPNWEEAANVLLWRQQDAIRNSILGLAQSRFPHSLLQGWDCAKLIDMLSSTEDPPWHDLPEVSQRGQFAARRKVTKALTPDILAKIPAAKRPDGTIERHEIAMLELPPLADSGDRVAVLFGA